MTAHVYVEDLTTTPFKKTRRYYKQFRQCKNEDYERYGDKGYVDDIEPTLGFFPENCIDNWKNLSLISQRINYKFGFLKVQIS